MKIQRDVLALRVLADIQLHINRLPQREFVRNRGKISDGSVIRLPKRIQILKKLHFAAATHWTFHLAPRFFRNREF